MGEISLVLSNQKNSGAGGGGATIDILLEALKYYLRSIELCEDYLRGYYGLLVVCGRLLKEEGRLGGGGKTMDRAKVEGLYERARARLVEITRRAGRREKGWEGYDEGEVEAARRLLEEEEIGEGKK